MVKAINTHWLYSNCCSSLDTAGYAVVLNSFRIS